MVSRAAALTVAFCLSAPGVVSALDRLPVPGGSNAIRRVTNLPDSVPDGMLLVEAARAWYGVRDPIGNPSPQVRGLIEHVSTSQESLEAGPASPLRLRTWSIVLRQKTPDGLARSLVGSRNGMLLYHGLMGMDDETLAWMETQHELLRDIFDTVAAPFASAAAAVRVRGGVVEVPGGADARREWEELLDESAATPAAFVRALLEKDHGRLAWLYSVLADLDGRRLRFALGEHGGQLRSLARAAARAAPEWILAERPFWRPAFDLSLVLSIVPLHGGRPHGSDAFWREVFREDDLQRFRAGRGAPLASGTLVGIVFDDPFSARQRWEVFSLGQRMPGVAEDATDAGRALRGARQHPALGLLLDRLEVRDVRLRASLHRAAARIASRDESGAAGEITMWQASLAILERGALTGGLDEASLVTALEEFAALRLDQPRTEITAWLMNGLVPRLMERADASPGAEEAVLEMMAGASTPGGRAAGGTFTWEDLPYVLAAPEANVRRMHQVRAAQQTPSLDDAQFAWGLAASGRGDVGALASRLRRPSLHLDVTGQARRLEEASKRRNANDIRKHAREAAEIIVGGLLPALAYAPHLAVTEVPELGVDVAFRHAFGTQEDGLGPRKIRPWLVARGYAQGGRGWNLQGSLLALDLAVSSWYLRRNGEPPVAAPVFDEMDVNAFAQVASIARSRRPSNLRLQEAVSAIAAGHERARASADLPALDELLRSSGITAWRRREIRLDAASVEQAGAGFWAAGGGGGGGAPGLLIARASLDGCACLGEAPRATHFLEGRRSAGVVAAGSVDVQLRVASFLRSRELPDDLFGEVAAGALNEAIEHTSAARPDDFRAIARAVSRMDDGRMEEHLLALVSDGTLARPAAATTRGMSELR
jgi:hypothetical protein